MKRFTCIIALLAACFAGPVAVALFLPSGAQAPVAASAVEWPAELVLWDGNTPVTQTAQHRSVGVLGADAQYLFYEAGPAEDESASYLEFQIYRKWHGASFTEQAITATIPASGSVRGVITITQDSLYPMTVVRVDVTTSTVTPTILFLGDD